jgi:hypothetical protein
MSRFFEPHFAEILKSEKSGGRRSHARNQRIGIFGLRKKVFNLFFRFSDVLDAIILMASSSNK